MLLMQALLQRITSQIEKIGRDIKRMVDFTRREKLSNKFFYARDKIMLEVTADVDEQEDFLK